jgi:hypothetical protein
MSDKTFVDPTWVEGNAVDLDAVCVDHSDTADAMREVDLVFTCPPYYNLEIYSDDPADLSNAEGYPAFLEMFEAAMRGAVARLRDNRFAVIVVGDLRDKEGKYYGFVADTINIMYNLDCPLYNDAVLVTAVGSLPVRVGAQMRSGRKLGKTHQNVLVFFKGDPKKIKVNFPSTIEMADLEALLAPEEEGDGGT